MRTCIPCVSNPARGLEIPETHLVVLIDKVKASVVGDERGDYATPSALSHNPKDDNNVPFFPFLINCTRTHFRMAELGCLASTPTFSRTIPLAWDDPPVGEDRYAVPRARFL